MGELPSAIASAPAALAGGCPAQMQAGVCGRPLHATVEGVDKVPVCLMHSKDPEKLEGPLYSKFLLEFKGMLADAGTGVVDFTGYVFPYLSLRSQEVRANCIFADAVFMKGLHLYEVTLKRGLEIAGARFEDTVHCDGVIFEGDAEFQDTVFKKQARFLKTVFKKEAVFYKAIFKDLATFPVTFEGPADFIGTEFEAEANFSNATFKQKAEMQTLFTRSVFLKTVFEQEVDFAGAMFAEDAVFPMTKFKGNVDFTRAIFNGETVFNSPEFSRSVNFTSAQFRARVRFSGTAFRTDDEPEAGPIFSLARFTEESRALFYRTDLSHALFHNCNLSNVTFSSVIWRKRPHTRTLMVLEEVIPLESDEASALKLEDGSRDYGLIAQLYQQLKKNYDDRLDYWAADDFHYGEMEMQRLAVPTLGPLLGLRQFYHRHLSLAAWYRRGSSYGNSYVRPAGWLLFVLVLFAALFPLTGLQRVATNPAAIVPAPLTYRSVWPARSPLHDKVWAEMKLLGRSELASVDTASFQKSSEYVPTYPWGRVLAIAEMLLTATLLALFLLAIRRQFRR
jgi:uncharacterized protein YjbI with pentapeptide repeats